MKAVAVQKYGSIENLVSVNLPKPSSPEGHDLLIRYKRIDLALYVEISNSRF